MEEGHRKQFKAAMTAIINSVSTVCKTIANPVGRQEAIDKLRVHLTELIEEEHRAEKSVHALLVIQSNILSSIQEGNVAFDVETKLDEVLSKEKLSKNHIEKHGHMKAFEDKVIKFLHYAKIDE